MRIVFCSEPFSPLRVDSAYESEADAAQTAGFDFDLVDFEALVDAGNPVAAIRKVKEQSSPVVAVYRGWMLKPEKYAQLFDALAKRNINLINSPVQYRHCHHLPESYSLIENYTPVTVSVKLNSDFSFDNIFRRLSVFGDKPLVLKDYVKSRKHEWNEACFIQSASDRAAVERVVNRFLELQGDDLNEGLFSASSSSLSRLQLTRKARCL